MSKDEEQPRAIRIDEWGFEREIRDTGRAVPLLGIFLIVLGLALVIGQLVEAAQIGASAAFLALGLVLLVVWTRQHGDLALYAGVFVTALALSDLLTGLNIVHGSGWRTLFLGIGVLCIVPIRMRAHRSWTGTAILGVLLALWGGGEVLATYWNQDLDRLVGPLLLVLLGVWIISQQRIGKRS
jgi:glucose dehydrogenase